MSLLVERFERLRFKALWQLGAAPVELERLEREVLLTAPAHPLVMNHRARLALPETELPPPPRGLSGIAKAWLMGDIRAARGLAEKHKGPRIQVIRGDLALAERAHQQALEHYSLAERVFGTHPPLLARQARCHLSLGEHQQAKQRVVLALSINPLYGSARTLRWEVGAHAGTKLRPVPLQAPIQVKQGSLFIPKDMDEESQRVWQAWYQGLLREDPTRPPRSLAHEALLSAFGSRSIHHEGTQALCELLALWRGQELLESYQWSMGLNPERAPQFRSWHDLNQDALHRFWDQGIEA